MTSEELKLFSYVITLAVGECYTDDIQEIANLENKIKLIDEKYKCLEKENQELKRQLEYLRSGEYYNQLRFERNMLQDVVNKMEVSKEDKKFIDMTHRNTKLLEENKNLKSQLDCALKLLSDMNPPCEIDGFMDNHTDYCEINCGVDEEVFKKCWLMYIKDELKEVE